MLWDACEKDLWNDIARLLRLAFDNERRTLNECRRARFESTDEMDVDGITDCGQC
jgi:hypothetical protein